MRELVLTDQAKADLAGLDAPRACESSPPSSASSKPTREALKNYKASIRREFRLRVGDWRVRFSYPDADTVRINRIQNLKDAYR